MKFNATMLFLSVYNVLISLLVVLFASYLHMDIVISVLGLIACMALFILGPLFTANCIENKNFSMILSLPISIGIFIGFASILQPAVGFFLSLGSFLIIYLTARAVKTTYKNQVKVDIKTIFERYILTVFFIYAAVGAASLMTFYPEVEDKLIQESTQKIKEYFDNNLLASFNLLGRDININASALGIDTRVTVEVVQRIKDYSVYIVAVLSLVTLLGLGTLSRIMWFVLSPAIPLVYKLLVKKNYYHVETVTVERQILTRKADE